MRHSLTWGGGGGVRGKASERQNLKGGFVGCIGAHDAEMSGTCEGRGLGSALVRAGLIREWLELPALGGAWRTQTVVMVIVELFGRVAYSPTSQKGRSFSELSLPSDVKWFTLTE